MVAESWKFLQLMEEVCGFLFVVFLIIYFLWGNVIADIQITQTSSDEPRRKAYLPKTYTSYEKYTFLAGGWGAPTSKDKNEVQVIQRDGWYRSVSGVDGDRDLYGEDMALYFQLEVDGKAVCISDENWEASQSGPVHENDMQQGKVIDARMEETWDYHEVKVEDFGVENLACFNCMLIGEMGRFEGTIKKTPNGETVIDYGQNLVGHIEFILYAHAGDRIFLTHGETLDGNGSFTQENFQDRKCHKEGGTREQGVYTCKKGKNHYKSRFTIWGFCYAKVETDIDEYDGVKRNVENMSE